MKLIKGYMLMLICLVVLILAHACKKCTICTAYDSSTSEIKFREESCSNGPLLDDWKNGIISAYPAPQYITTCE